MSRGVFVLPKPARVATPAKATATHGQRVIDWIEIRFDETRSHVMRVLKNYLAYKVRRGDTSYRRN
jgi:soluble lytic murein transglycosylase-like protein